MMIDLWTKMSFMIQMAGACYVFMIPLRKRSFFVLRTGLVTVLFAFAYYIFNSSYTTGIYIFQDFLYWGSYFVVSVLLVWAGIDGSISQVVFCTVCAYAIQHISMDMFWILRDGFCCNDIISALVYIGIHIVSYHIFAKRLSVNGQYLVTKADFVPMATIVLLVWLLSVFQRSGLQGFEAGRWYQVLYHLIDALCCLYALWVQVSHKEIRSLQKEIDGINRAWSQQTKQYQITEENIKFINQRCHDLKHQLNALRYVTDEEQKKEFFDEIERAVMIYDTSINTGNKALDTVLIEKGLYCQSNGIRWSCMADGSGLNFMKVEDLYAVMGNALSNAIEAVMELKDERKKTISVRIITQNDLVMIQIQNYYDKELKFVNGIPETTQKNKSEHGYGMKSIKYVAEKYSGTMTVDAKDSVFTLQLLFPMQ